MYPVAVLLTDIIEGACIKLSKSPAVAVRLLSEADLDLFWPVRLRALKEEPDSFGMAYEEALQISSADVLTRLQCSNDSFVFGAFRLEQDTAAKSGQMANSALIGILGFFRHQGLKARHKGTIWGVYVAPEGRGLGVGRQLMQAGIERASTLPDLERLFLTVNPDNPISRGLYASLGFVGQSIEKRAIKIGDRYVDEELMALEIIKTA